MQNEKEIQAAVAAMLAGGATQEQSALVEQWKDASESNRRTWERLSAEGAAGEMLAAMRQTDVEQGWQRMERRMRPRPADRRLTERRLLIRRIGVAAASVAAAVGFVFMVRMKTAGDSEVLQLPQPAGAELILADGSVVPIDARGNTEIIRDGAGATIYKDSSHIDYSRGAVEDDAPEIYNELRMPAGMDYKMTLSDGTCVYLNAQSRLRFPVKFSGDRRVVEFEGEAYFSVAKDADHPFVIMTGGMEVKVLGTEFNLRAYGDEPEIVTTLVSGRVQLRDQTGVCDIEPGVQAVYTPLTGVFTTREVDVDFYTAWCRSELLFRDTRLDEMMRNLARWYGVEYEFADERAAQTLLGGSFRRTDSIEPILDMIRRTGLLDVTVKNNRIYFSTRAS